MRPVVIPRSDHPVSRRDIDEYALKVLYRLHRAGHVAYMVGGGVRDLLVGIKPKDFDIATDAHPQKIRKLFRNCVLVGRRFRLAHVRFGSTVIEVSTFRRTPEPGEPVADESASEDLLIRRDNTFGTPEDDALRRDFTVNALFYDIGTYSLIDYVGGLRDLEDGLMRSIGDPHVRYQEDPVRMLRAVKFAARLGFEITPDDLSAIAEHRDKLQLASTPRLLEEIYKLLRGGASAASFKLMAETRLLDHLLPEIVDHLDRTGAAKDPENAPFYRSLFALDDALHHEDHPGASNSMLLAMMVMPLLNEQLVAGGGPRDAWDASPAELDDAFEAVVRPILRRLTVSRRDSDRLRNVVLAQPRLTDSEGPRGKRGALLARRPELHESVDVLLMCAEIVDDLRDLAVSWNQYASKVEPVADDFPPPRRRRRKPRGEGAGAQA
jgi:poly(A) polymerase